MTIPYVLEEVAQNLKNLPPRASAAWVRLRRQLVVEDNVLSLDRPAIFPQTKDRPILFSALAWADALLTLDSRHFGDLLGGEFYGLPVLRPGNFLERERAMKRLR